MATEQQQVAVMKLVSATTRQCAAAVGEIVTAHGMGAATPVNVNVMMDNGRQEVVTTTPAQLLQQVFEALVDLTGAVDDLIEALPNPKKTAPKRRRKKV